jgi:hypothetical protein
LNKDDRTIWTVYNRGKKKWYSKIWARRKKLYLNTSTSCSFSQG